MWVFGYLRLSNVLWSLGACVGAIVCGIWWVFQGLISSYENEFLKIGSRKDRDVHLVCILFFVNSVVGLNL